MNSIQTDFLALDTNEFVLALRESPVSSSCGVLVFEKLSQLKVYIPLQVIIELNRNLSNLEVSRVFAALSRAKALRIDYAKPPQSLIDKWLFRGAKKGDAVIVADLEMARINYLISENRHFISELTDLPFTVLSSREVLDALG